ncbi:TonB-linked SusC/RagA family outer membrane protein [Mesonia hippocampi]|uniref:TonB-linked SusC/RagA family outer membrane protein n=1 Tax=Mesonia hippocampi TaxID=1628250 RepID=A0A840EUS0_9FLAO|nr:SusC/RagA family TonB-linked outer membrane protein [Mesonia hippocampi]MBB4119216.1 TonB-linked SusC/RagA family outer membrane protein [Mesonia hippocampi]
MIKEKLRNPIIVTFLLFCSFIMSAQERNISGMVTGASDGIPIPFVNITIKDKPGKGATTDFDGNYTINAATGDVLVFSTVGMKTKQQTIGTGSTYNISLETDIAELEAVVITGFDNVEERLFTGANSTISAEDLKVDGVVDVSRMLEGKAAGVNIQNVTGTFGAAPKITIRGASSIFGDTKPLFVIDGVVQEDIIDLDFDELASGDATTLIGSSIAGLNANDIAGIEILKDASATALYGARALNGVVVINTISGKRETPTTINYTLEQTVRATPKYSQYDILNSQETMSIFKEMEAKGFLTQAGVVQSRSGGVYYTLYDKINRFIGDDYTSPYSNNGFEVTNTPEYRNLYLQQYEKANTDWFKTLFRQSITQNHSLSFSGGGEHNSYYASVSFFNDPGLTIADDVKRLTTNFKNTFYLSDKFNLTLSSKASKRSQKAPGTYAKSNDVVSGEVSRNFDINPFSYTLNTNRTVRPRNNNGGLEYIWDNYAPFNIINELNNNYIELDVMDFLFQVDANYKITDKLTYNLTASGRYVNSSSEHNVTENANAAEAYRSMGTTIIRDNNPFLFDDPENPTEKPRSVLPYGGMYNKRDNTLESYYVRNTLNYKTKLNDIHDLVVFGGQDLRYVDRNQTFFEGYGMQYDKGYVPNINPDYFDKYIGEGGQYFGKSTFRERTVSFFGKVTYGYDNRYIVALTGRYDGSNRQGKSTSSRWLPTWSISGKWNAAREKFLEDSKIISNLTIRPSYGLTATAGPATNSLAIFRSESIFRKSVSQRENMLSIVELQNDDLTWEKQYETNIGLDLGLLENRINISADVYQRKGFDLIDYVNTSGIGGQYVKAMNDADMTTKGFELSINSTNIKTEDFSWSTTLNFSIFDQEVTKLQNKPNVLDLVDLTGGNVVGYPRNSLFSFDFQGLNDQGLPTFILPEGSSSITGANFQDTEDLLDYLVYEGSIEPNKTAGFSNTFNYKNWSLNMFISASWGNKIRLNPTFSSSYSDLDVFTKDFANRWLLPGDEDKTNIPVIADRRLVEQYPNLNRAYNAYNYSTARVADGGFVRMKNISLSYNFPKEFVNKLGMSKFSLKALATNPFLIYSDDKLNGQDPEFFMAGGVSYPIMQQYTLSLNLSI